jgi:hypothetical protein
LPKGGRILHIGKRRAAENRVIPNIKHIGRKANLLAFVEREILDDGDVPILLKGAPIDVAAQRAEARGGSVVADNRGRLESSDVHVPVEVRTYTAAGIAGGNRGPRSEIRRGGDRSERNKVLRRPIETTSIIAQFEFCYGIQLIDVEIPPNNHFAVVSGEHLFQKVFWR